jgi:hypothetical protein
LTKITPKDDDNDNNDNNEIINNNNSSSNDNNSNYIHIDNLSFNTFLLYHYLFKNLTSSPVQPANTELGPGTLQLSEDKVDRAISDLDASWKAGSLARSPKKSESRAEPAQIRQPSSQGHDAKPVRMLPTESDRRASLHE